MATTHPWHQRLASQINHHIISPPLRNTGTHSHDHPILNHHRPTTNSRVITIQNIRILKHQPTHHTLPSLDDHTHNNTTATLLAASATSRPLDGREGLRPHRP